MTNMMITVASWETRFIKGFQNTIERLHPVTVFQYYYEEYAELSARNRNKVKSICKKNDIILRTFELSFRDHSRSWHQLYKSISEDQLTDEEIVVDLTTMPRETIWTILDLLEFHGAIINWVYYQPQSYNQQWLSREPGKPRLVYKLAGEVRLGIPTKLLVLTGYDVGRIKQLIRFFEPQLTMLGMQVGDQLNNQSLNFAKTRKSFDSEPDIDFFDVDAYSEDQGLSAIQAIIKPHFTDSNVVMSSLGPKLSAIALYRLHKKYPQTSLAYAPSNEFNPNYSRGLGEMFTGSLQHI